MKYGSEDNLDKATIQNGIVVGAVFPIFQTSFEAPSNREQPNSTGDNSRSDFLVHTTLGSVPLVIRWEFCCALGLRSKLPQVVDSQTPLAMTFALWLSLGSLLGEFCASRQFEEEKHTDG